MLALLGVTSLEQRFFIERNWRVNEDQLSGRTILISLFPMQVYGEFPKIKNFWILRKKRENPQRLGMAGHFGLSLTFATQ